MVEKTINRESLRWLLLEGTAIVLSILLAFGIDAWWSERQNREVEQLVLTSLLEDFRAKKELVDWQRPYMDAILDSTNELLYASAEADRELGNESIDHLLGDIWWNNNTAPWSAPLLNSLIAGGDLALVSSAELRNGLIGWSDRFAQVQEAIAREVDFYDTRFMSFLEVNASMPQVLNTIEHAPGDPELIYNFGEKFLLEVRVDHSKLLSSQQFQGLLARRSVLLNDILTQAFRQLEDDLDATIAEIEQELIR
jgi:hypothetical protein